MSSNTRRVLVTGASGFIGGHTCEALLARGWQVRAMVRATSDVSHLAGLPIERAIADLGDAAALARACEGVDTIVHTAAVVGSFGEWEHYYQTGVVGTQRLVDAAAHAGVSRFVHVSSIATYGFRPHGRRLDEDTPFDRNEQRWNHYVREKVMSEDLVWKAHREGRIRATSVRPVIVIGARDRNALPRLVDLLRLPVCALPGRPDNRFPLVTIEDCVDAIVRATENEAAVGRAYNVSGDDPIGLDAFFALLAKHTGLNPPRVYLPTGAMVPAVGLLENAWKVLRRPGEPVATRIAVTLCGYDYDIDCRRAQQELHWSGKGSYEAAIVAGLAKPAASDRGSLAS